jgi:hypothetical protein
MAKTYKPPFAQTAKTGTAVLTAASVITTDAPTNTVEIATAGSDGALVTSLSFMPRATVTATALYLFVSKDSGTTKRLIDSELMSAYTMAATTATPETKFANISETTPLRLEASDKLYVSIGVALASGIVAKCEWTDF